MKGLGVRIVSGVALLVVVLLAIWVQGWLLELAVALAAGLAAHEFYVMARRAGYAPWYPAGMALALMLALRGYLAADLFTNAADVRRHTADFPLPLRLCDRSLLGRSLAALHLERRRPSRYAHRAAP